MTDFSTLPANSARAITPSDTVNIALTRAVYVGGSGDIVAIMGDGAKVTFAGAVAGSVLPLRVTRINSTDTTATNLVALY